MEDRLADNLAFRAPWRGPLGESSCPKLQWKPVEGLLGNPVKDAPWGMLYGVPTPFPSTMYVILVSDGGMVSENDPGIVLSQFLDPLVGIFLFTKKEAKASEQTLAPTGNQLSFCSASNDQSEDQGLGREPEMSLSHRAAASSCASSGKAELCACFLVRSLGSEFLPR